MIVAYKQEQRGRKEAAADRKKRVQLLSLSEAPKAATDIAMDTTPHVVSEDRPFDGEQSSIPVISHSTPSI